MIYTLTFNPALDYIITPDNASVGSVTRTTAEKLLPGGKGINVSIVLKNIGISSTALGFSAGFTGKELERMLTDMGVVCDFIHSEEGLTRINVKIRYTPEREFNAQGPRLLEGHIAKLSEKLDSLDSNDILVLSGSAYAGADKSIYSKITERLSKKGVKIVVDAEGELLTSTLPHQPFLVKPNHYELSAIFGVSLTDKTEIAKYGKRLQNMGAKNVFVSMGAEGGILITENGKALYSPAPKGRLVNSTGAGDSAVAGFLAGYIETESLEDAFLWAIAAGSASAFSENLTTKEEFDTLLNSMRKKDISYL